MLKTARKRGDTVYYVKAVYSGGMDRGRGPNKVTCSVVEVDRNTARELATSFRNVLLGISLVGMELAKPSIDLQEDSRNSLLRTARRGYFIAEDGRYKIGDIVEKRKVRVKPFPTAESTGLEKLKRPAPVGGGILRKQRAAQEKHGITRFSEAERKQLDDAVRNDKGR